MATDFKTLFNLVIVLGLLNDLAHYPPAKTSNTQLDQVLNGSGAPRIYSTSITPDSRYGEYSCCAMPHVRKQEYKVPSKEYELETPYASNTFFKEDISWDCSDEGNGPD
ncbi:uncharacterized protein IAS62_005885 [Cryptococcus decagattii]|uniref:Uncharacterized protein n=1 Tax=Cryptococcus decagattii TaxID=1859122 RepID=A0ABZ2B143_9TREE